jgi:hypothetical protein
MARRRQYRGSGRQGGYTASERAAVPTSMFLKPETRSWPVGDRRHVSIALQYMQRGFGNRSEYPQYLARLLQIWPPDQHPDVLEELERKLPSIANMMSPVRAAANPTPVEAEIQRMLDNPPFSWEDMMRQYGLSAGVSPETFYSKILEFTPSMNRYGPKGGSGHVPPDEVRQAALLGLRLSYKNDYTSASGIGVARAVQLALAPSVWDRTITRMNAYFIRHRKDQNSSRFGDMDDPSRGFMAWLNWGGDPGWEWARQQLGVAQPNPRRRGYAQDNPDTYNTAIEFEIDAHAVMDAGRETVYRYVSYDRYTPLRDLELNVDSARAGANWYYRNQRLTRYTAEWLSEYFEGYGEEEVKDYFFEKLKEYRRLYLQRMRGVMAMPEVQQSVYEAPEKERYPYELYIRDLVRRMRKGKFADQFLADRQEEADRRAGYRVRAKKRKSVEATGSKQAEAAYRLGYEKLPLKVMGERAEWVCSAEPDKEKCASALVEERAGQPVRFAKHPVWWYDISVVPPKHRKKVRRRLGEEWVYLANTYDVRSFLPDVAYAPKKTLAWMEGRQPSRKAVQKGLRKFVNSLPPKHDFSSRPVPMWVEEMDGRHVLNERDLRAVGKPNGWCFGSSYAAKYLNDLKNGYDLYFLTLNGRPTAVWVDRKEKRHRRGKVYYDEVGPFVLKEAKYPRNAEAIYDMREALEGNLLLENTEAKTNPDRYPPDVESLIAEYAVLQAARATLGASSRSTNEKLRSFRELTEAIKRLKGKRGKRHTLEKVVEKWARSNLRANADRNMFREELARASARLRRDVRGITALPPKPFMDDESSEDGENIDLRREAVRLVYGEKKPFHQAYPEVIDEERQYRLQAARGRAGLDEDGFDPSAEAGRVAKAAKRMGWKRLPPLHHGEQTHWVCAAEPDEEKCKRVIVYEKVPLSPADMGEMDGDDQPEDGQYKVGVQYVREPFWWYDLNVMPYQSQEEVRSRLGADWVYMANKHDARRFFGDIAAHPSAALDWLDQRKPSRKAVDTKLRDFIKKLPVSHDYSARPTPRWIERLEGHHVENENEVKVGGKRYGWCFGGIHNATYMAMIDDDHELYFATVKNRPVAIFIKRDTQGQTYDADLNKWSAASIYQDEYGPFALIEAKYPQNDEAINDLKALMGKMKYSPEHPDKNKTIQRRRGR